MISAVLDTNVLVSGLGWRDSVPGRIVDAMIEGRFVAVTSPLLLDELHRVLAYPRLRDVIVDAERLVSLVTETSVMVRRTRRVEILSDEADNRVLEVAVAAGAELVVTGDAEWLSLGAFEETRIVTARRFLEELG